MSLFRSFCIAFGMYSKIPMPKFEWRPKDMRYTMCFFPLIGIPIALLVLLWYYLCQWLHIHSFLFACGITVIPVLVTGGIHLDGYCDTVDALSSRQPREKKLEILKDPHIGTFAMLFCCLYFLLYAGFATELSENLYSILLLMCSFFLSRCISGFAAVTFRSAKSNGLLHTFIDAAQKRIVVYTMIGYFILTSTLLFVIDWFIACFALAAALLTFLYVRIMCYRQFGGITGDIAGYLVQLCELTTLIGIIAGSLIEKAVF